jgi:soluble lytic murein transglycosylase
MVKKRITKTSLVITLALCCPIFLASCDSLSQFTGGKGSETSTQKSTSTDYNAQIKASVFLSPQERVTQLETLFLELRSPSSPEQKLALSRIRYLLASDLSILKQEQKALDYLKDLEKDYPVLASHITLKRAQIYQEMGNAEKGKTTWEEIIKNYPNDPVVVEAFYVLGKKNPDYWEKAIAQFPSHPRTIDIARQKILENPNQIELLLLIAKHGLYLKNYGDYLEQLTKKFNTQLSPEQWDAIAWGYWEKQDYEKAAIAYSKAKPTPKTLYRYGRGLWLKGKIAESKQAYQQLIQTFPQGEETGLGLIRLSRLQEPQDAIPLLDRVIQNFPKNAPEALLDKAKILEKNGSEKAASQTRQILLSKYSNSDAAAELRWNLAQKAALMNEYKIAWQWAREIIKNNPEHELAPQSGFWVGKWAQNLGLKNDAEQSFEYVLSNYPSSYFAWRSAVLLGWNVGDFTTLRKLSPNVIRPQEQPVPLTGSDALKELYQLGQSKNAWTLWQVEFKNPQQPTVSEQFTDGLMRLGIGDNLEGLWMISSLNKREKPEEIKEYLTLKKQMTYWEALYPFPYLETIVKWSKQRALNPVLVTALIRQESRFMPTIKSVVGATGLMQVMPETAADIAPKINLKKYSLENVNDNVNLGTWYLGHTHDEYNNNSMLAVASYNAGPGAVGGWLTRFGFKDPDAFVEKIPYPETQDYVKSVFENYWNYLRIYNPEISQQMAEKAVK